MSKISNAHWPGPHTEVARRVAQVSKQCLAAYKANPLLIAEHVNIEIGINEGGYERRQLYELVQNAADELVELHNGRIEVLLTEDALYCANQGRPITPEGVETILSSHLSRKRGDEIGRFGLGFKSVLGVSSTPQVYSRSGSFVFDPITSAARIRGVVGEHGRAPVLRLADPVDPSAEAKHDRHLEELMEWASTVIKLPLDKGDPEWLHADLVSFPAEFLLFCNRVGLLVLHDQTRSIRREIRTETREGKVLLEENGKPPEVWRVFSIRHRPSETAKKSAGELANRETLPLMWAVPLQGRQLRGTFWAFFPTEYVTTLSGILNAPWKTNEDRQNLLSGSFNTELIDVAAKLVAKSLAELADPADPGRYLDLMPARGREAPNWADGLLTEKVYEHAAKLPSVPDQDGKLRPPQEIALHPEGMPKEALELWASYPERPKDWCHHAAESATRRSRVERLLSLQRRFESPVEAWLEALVTSRTPAASIAALKVAAAVAEKTAPALAGKVRDAKILLTARDTLVKPRPERVFIGHDEALVPESLEIVHGDIASDLGGRCALEALGIGEVDAASELRTLLDKKKLSSLEGQDWPAFWELVRKVSTHTAVELIRRAGGDSLGTALRVRTMLGRFMPLERTLLPGQIIPADGGLDRDAAVDVRYHESDLAVLRELGASEVPLAARMSRHESWFPNYRAAAIAEFERSLPPGRGNPHDRYLILEGDNLPGPLAPLLQLSNEGKARFTRLLLAELGDECRWTVRHQTRPENYPTQEVRSPLVWLLQQEGWIDTSLGPRALKDCVAPGLSLWRRFLPVAECTEKAARMLRLKAGPAEITPPMWEAALTEANRVDDISAVAAFYAFACPYMGVPSSIRCLNGTEREYRRPASVAVTGDPDVAAALRNLNKPFLETATQAEADLLVKRWALSVPELTFETQGEPTGSPIPLQDRFPGISGFLEDGDGLLQLVPCRSLRCETITPHGKHSDPREIAQRGDTILYADHLAPEELLDRLTEFKRLKLEPEDRQAILDSRELNEQRRKVAKVRDTLGQAAKLVAAVGEEAIRRKLPAGLTVAAGETAEHRLSAEKIAELALAVYGVETLHEFREELQREGFGPPAQWAGGSTARAFVRSLAFPPEFAGFPQARRDAIFDVEGPPRLNPLHPFQQVVETNVRRLFEPGAEMRGVLSLPTGAGKTRVCVEALINLVKQDRLAGPILWVAQTDELCEQAVQAWAQVWRSLGPEQTLRISRLWSQNEADQFYDGVQLVVATAKKLHQSCIRNPAYEWLTEAECIVIDEAHAAIERMYTEILTWQGLTFRQERCPLIGLTATPFRGGEEETKRLVSRFGGLRLDGGALGDDPYGTLQSQGYLAEVDHQLMEGASVRLSEAELAALRDFRTLPQSAENRLGEDKTRNRALLASIGQLPQDWPILLFSVSVHHAQTMAALLNAAGISAAAISGETDAGARRHYIDQFQRGKTRVLTNYGVLTTGFDAPKVRAVYVARPVFSPVLYQQMIGRGLRGPRNGGTERCLIVNVKDTFEQFGEDLAFHEFEHLWKH